MFIKFVFAWSLFSVLPFVFTGTLSRNGPNKITLTVFYETQCPYSMKFFTNQLSTLFDNSTQLYRYVNFDLIPFGKAEVKQVGEQFMFSCQHGPQECDYNKLHSCVTAGVSLINNDEVNRIYVPFLICMMSAKNENSVMKECTDRYEIPPDWLMHCQNGRTGAKLLARNGLKTRRFTPKIVSVPTIVVNGQYNDNDQKLGEYHLSQLVCKYVRPKPNVCNSISM